MNATVTHSFNACLSDYLREVYCVCPKCRGVAVIHAEAKCAIPWRPFNVKLVCLSCVFRQDWPSPAWKSDFTSFDPASGLEPYFGYPLLCIKPVGKYVIAILNREHAQDIISYIEATHRPDPANSKSMVCRLPKWMKLGKNRATVIKAVKDLISKLP